MAAKKKSAPAAEPFSEAFLEAARQFRSIRLARIPKSQKSDKGPEIRKRVKAYMRERLANS
jgi:hypothetical protein